MIAEGGALRAGTRGSELARWQTRFVSDSIRAISGAPEVEEMIIRTEGDWITDVPLSRVEGKAFFTKEIEEALLAGEVDLAVHSLKDLATEMPPGLEIGAVLEREDPRDVVISGDGSDLDRLPPGARIGTSSLRRRALIARWRPDLELVEMRGNVPTRIRKLRDSSCEAIVLAAAGVIRLGLEENITAYLPLERMLPAVSQGAMAVQVRSGDSDTQSWIGPIDHRPTRFATTAERALLNRLEGGCQIPVGALATVDGDTIDLSAVVCSLDGSSAIEGRRSGPTEEAEHLGTSLAEQMLREGADRILEGIRRGVEGTD